MFPGIRMQLPGGGVWPGGLYAEHTLDVHGDDKYVTPQVLNQLIILQCSLREIAVLKYQKKIQKAYDEYTVHRDTLTAEITRIQDALESCKNTNVMWIINARTF